MIDDKIVQDLLEIYHELYLQAIKGGMDEKANPLWGIWRKLDDTLVSMGVLEADEDQEEEEIKEDPAGAYADHLYDIWKDRQIMAELGGYEL